jgi:hypothetical protein
MDNYVLPFDAMRYKLKTARQKKRLQKEDFDKQVIQIIKKRDQYWQQKHNLPWIPLKIPYQSGWKRHFVLREDIKRSDNAGFYHGLLKNINTAQYAADKSFKIKRKRKKGKTVVERKQFLREFPDWQWNDKKYHSLTELERTHFQLHEKWDNKGKIVKMVYRFNEPWRYVLKIVPNMITHVKMLDSQLEQDIQRLDNFITQNQIEAKIYKLTGGGYHYWKWADFDKPRYIESKKEALLQIKEAIENKKQEKF